MKTIKELAEELGVSKEAIRQSIANKVSRKTPENSSIVAVLQATLDELHSQLEAKDEQIECLIETLADKKYLLAQQ